MRNMIRYQIILISVLVIGACSATGKKNTDVDRAKLAQTQVQLGLGYMQKGQLDLAKPKLERALEIDPKLAGAHNAMAMYYERTSQNDLANRYYKAATKLDPEDGFALNNYGVFLCKNGRFSDAEKYLLKAAKLPEYPTPEYAYENLGLCALGVQNLEKAEEYLRKAIAIDENLPVSLIQMSSINFQQQQFLPARAYIQRFEAVAEHSADSLWLAFQIEEKLGATDRMTLYAEQLRDKFPESEQVRKLPAGY